MRPRRERGAQIPSRSSRQTDHISHNCLNYVCYVLEKVREAIANNQHPLQLATYTEYNRFLADLHDKATAERDAEDGARFNVAVGEAQKQLNTAEGETLSLDDLSDIYMQVKGANRARANMSLETRSKNGDINDYLEVRRPFGSAQ